VVVVTHYAPDHLAAAVDLLTADGIDVDAVYDRGGDRDEVDSDAYRAYYDLVTTSGVRRIVDIGDTWQLCDDERAQPATFTVVSAGTDGTAAGDVMVSAEPDKSLCLRVTVPFSTFAALTCGPISGIDDAGRADVESAVASTVGDVDWVTVNQSGATGASNPDFITTMNAQAGLVSVGTNPPADQPDPDVLRRWADHGTRLFLTHREGRRYDGDVTVTVAAAVPGFRVRTDRMTHTLAVGLDPVPPLPDGDVDRLRGADRIATAIEVSRAVFPGGSGWAVLATARDYPDALTGSVLAAQYGAPLLLIERDAIPRRCSPSWTASARATSSSWGAPRPSRERWTTSSSHWTPATTTPASRGVTGSRRPPPSPDA
jgi:beta-lactamase superfamily II metal-dependent hydrolase